MTVVFIEYPGAGCAEEVGISPKEAREKGSRSNEHLILLPVDKSAQKPLTLNNILLSSY